MKKALYYAVIVIFAPLWGMAQPSVVSFTPTRNALNIEKNTNITVAFDRDIDQSTINNSTIKINGSLSGPYAATYSYNSSTKTATISPATPFKVGEVVTTTLTRGIKSAVGNSLIIQSYVWSFSIMANANSSGKFLLGSTLSSGGWSITSGDFSGDGHLDLAVAQHDGRVFIFLNNGNGTFTQTSTLSVGGGQSQSQPEISTAIVILTLPWQLMAPT
jgi:hypothetical protein